MPGVAREYSTILAGHACAVKILFLGLNVDDFKFGGWAPSRKRCFRIALNVKDPWFGR